MRSRGGPGKVWKVARTLGRRGRGGKGLPPLLFFTDPVRTPDPAAILARLPAGAGVVYRAFGDVDAVNTARRLRALALRKGLIFLVGADEPLAAACRADGLHLPERDLGRARRLRARHRNWILTAAVHSTLALARAGRAGVDAAVLSAIFPSRSASAGSPLGPRRLSAWIRAGKIGVYALGGVNGDTSSRLARTGAIGIAAIEGVLD